MNPNSCRFTPVCYLICFAKPYQAKSGKQEKQARHYIGWTINLEKRVKLHKAGQGARLLAIANQEGIAWSVVRIWPNGSYALEQKLKARHNHRQLCPCCNKRLNHLLSTQPLERKTS